MFMFLHTTIFVDICIYIDIVRTVCGSLLRYKVGVIKTLRPRPNARIFSRRHFEMHILEWKCINFITVYSNNGSDNGLAPTRQQAIIWTNDG